MNSNSDAADGRHTTPGGITGENLLIPESGSGPGLLLLADGQVPETAVQARARLFAEEGYVTAVLCGALAAPDVREAAIRLKDSAETTGGRSASPMAISPALRWTPPTRTALLL